jgi:hypothetical protein
MKKIQLAKVLFLADITKDKRICFLENRKTPAAQSSLFLF